MLIWRRNRLIFTPTFTFTFTLKSNHMRFFVYFFCYAMLQASCELYARGLSEVAMAAHKKVSKKLFKKVDVNVSAGCEKPLRLFYGTKELGFYELKAHKNPPLKKTTLKVLPLRGKPTSHKFFCLSKGKLTFLTEKTLKASVPKLFRPIDKESLKSPLKTPFILAASSIPFVSMDFTNPKGRQNAAYIYMMNKFGEVIWVYVPKKGEELLAHDTRLFYDENSGFTLVSGSYYEVFSMDGDIKASGYLCKKICKKEKTPLLASVENKKIHLAISTTKWLRSLKDLSHWLEGPIPITATQMGVYDMESKTLSLEESGKNNQFLVGYKKKGSYKLTLTLDDLTISSEENTLTLPLKKALDGAFLESKSVLRVLTWAEGKALLLKYKIDLKRKSYELLNQLAIKTDKKWHAAYLKQASNDMLYIYAIRSNPQKHYKQKETKDLLLEVDTQSSSIQSKLTFPVFFYSQNRTITPLESLPGTLAYRGIH